MTAEQESPVRSLLEELRSDPTRFQRRGGYERLRELLHEGGSPVPVKELLRENAPYVGDVLWTICELDDLAPYVEEAALHTLDPDPGTAAYAVEVLLRAAETGEVLRAALHCVESGPRAVAEHAALVLAGQGLKRAAEVFLLGGWHWAAALIDDFEAGGLDAEASIETLIRDSRQGRVVAGLFLATITSERTEKGARPLERSEAEWIRRFGQQLRDMFSHRWDVER